MEVAGLYRADPAFDVQRLVDELVASESVPLLPALRYTETGLRKRVEWERTWDLQRQEDRIEAELKAALTIEGEAPQDDTVIRYEQSLGAPMARRTFFEHPEDDGTTHPTWPSRLFKEIVRCAQQRELGLVPVPPRYVGADFQETTYWRLRGKLDVPKERWVTFPHCDGPDGLPVVAWAGYDALQMARAVSAYFVDVQERYGGAEDPRLAPLLGCLVELLPWLKQWHNEIDPEFGMRMGDYFEGFIQDEARRLGQTVEDVRGWQPPARTGRRGRRTK
jgi:hypothetical protein